MIDLEKSFVNTTHLYRPDCSELTLCMFNRRENVTTEPFLNQRKEGLGKPTALQVNVTFEFSKMIGLDM